jgi:hypothetical protein
MKGRPGQEVLLHARGKALSLTVHARAGKRVHSRKKKAVVG